MTSKLAIPWKGRPPEGELTTFIAKAQACFQRQLMRQVWGMVKDWDSAEDIVQEAFVKLYAHLLSQNHIKDVEAWLRKVAENTALNYTRQEQLREHIHAGLSWLTLQTQLDSLPEKKECLSALREQIEHLPNQQRRVVRLRDFEEMNFDDIAWRLECQSSTVRNIYRQAMINLRAQLLEKFPDGGASL